MDDATEPPITLHPHSRRVRVVIDGTVLADTTRAIELRERGYPPRQYLPRDDVRMDLLTPSDTVTHCPFKGDATYFSFGEHKDLAWSYERPMEGMEEIGGAVVFYRMVSSEGFPRQFKTRVCPELSQIILVMPGK